MKKFHQDHNYFCLVTFFTLDKGLNLENVSPAFSSFSPSQSLPSFATDAIKQLQGLNIAFNNKTGPSFLESIDALKGLTF